MYVARFSYAIKPVDRDQALALLRQEVQAAKDQSLEARLLVPLTRSPGRRSAAFMRSAATGAPMLGTKYRS